ncbi:aldehyde dehydrogenase family protein [Oculatella sp. LEGE 06141]|uniref:aldehyde dehydrogenase family protein n=1 Tax=Oculatella sp. LEGE 06141 TaxID=1828648 RepID=UPI00187E2BBC|nr:aldehyde dehydrogenase family protein [Oculatella sp. LEGE 06141]MBE9177358.1 aldehyde dehydrogenase family protein [Oculatella sp. LEGE 06141]
MLTIVNPSTEDRVEQLPDDTVVTIAHKVEQAKHAQAAWANTSLAERIQVIRRFNQLLVEQAEGLASLLTAEMGKPITQARAEVQATTQRIPFFLEQVERVIQTETVLADPNSGLREQISHEPLGVVANISAWNYPYFVGTNVFIPALLTGNAVLYKPSEYAALTGQAIAHLMGQAGVPEGVFQLILGTGEVGALLLEHPLNGVFFTGSYATGCKVAAAASRHLMKVQLELGGKDPAYVCDDVDVATVAAALVDGTFYNTGQSCCAIERIYVHYRIYPEFVAHFVKRVEGLQVGDPTLETTYIGPLARRAQLQVLEHQIADAVAKGAKLAVGGYRLDRPGYFFAPAVLLDTTHAMTVMREESFGPVIGIQPVSDDAEAVQLMSDTPYGLTASVYTAQEKRARAILQQMNSGTVYWNCCDRVSPRLPWSGRGHSGVGLTLSTYGIQTFTQPKAWHLRTN